MPAPIASRRHDTHGKALSLNLDESIYGTLAEIGAGQEVARWFLSVGAASGTVAKTISAYDKKVSDAIYGGGTRYVSRERLLAMLDHEYQRLLELLNTTEGKGKRFFAFADTIAARNYKGDNEQHGWVGIRFQIEPGAPPSQMLLHINLRDPAAQLQQQAIGTLGVNLIYAAYCQRADIAMFLMGLYDDLSIDRIEIDVIELEGPAFMNQDAGAWCLALLDRHMSHAIVFDDKARVIEPSSLLRKRPLLVMRGTFDKTELLDPAWLQSACRMLVAERGPFEREPLGLTELSIHHVTRVEEVTMDRRLEWIRKLTRRGAVIASDFPETYLLARYLRRHSVEPVRFVLSVAAAAKILNEFFYQKLPGSLLEGLGRLLATNVKIYVVSMPREAFVSALQDTSGELAVRESGKGLVTLDDLNPGEPACHLLKYLRASNRIVSLEQSYSSSILQEPLGSQSG
jgi:hypothetical protein